MREKRDGEEAEDSGIEEGAGAGDEADKGALGAEERGWEVRRSQAC